MAHLALRPGAGRVARFADSAVFIPADAAQASSQDSIEQLLSAFERGATEADEAAADRTAEPGDAMNLPAAAVPFALVDWSALTSPPEGAWPSGSGVRVVVAGAIRVAVVGPHVNETILGTEHRVADSVVELAGATMVDIHVSPADLGHAIASTPAAQTDLVVGVVPAESMSLSLATPAARASGRPIELADQAREWGAVSPPQFAEVVADDNTLTPSSSISWPDDSPPPGDATQRRGERMHPTAMALQLPSGVTVPVDATLVIGREPDPRAGRVDRNSARLLTIDAPTTVSRTHLIVRKHPQHTDRVNVIDCGSRGSTAILSLGATEPRPIAAWQPHEVSVGDRLLLGGPTAISVVGVAPTDVPDSDDQTLDASTTLSPLPVNARNTPEANR